MAACMCNEILIFSHDSQIKCRQVTEIIQFFNEQCLGESFILFVTFLKYADCVLFKIAARELKAALRTSKMLEKIKVDNRKERLNLFEVVTKTVNGW